jgi:hypothetical protein
MLDFNYVFLDLRIIDDSPLLRADVVRAVRTCLELKREMQQYADLVGLTFDPGVPNHPDTKSDPVDLA